jgi:TFIIF-interacting CTD phosphatase-like protein
MRLRIECITAVGLRQHFDSIIKAPLPPRAPRHEKRHTLVLDIDETLVHTFSQSASAADERLMEYGMLVRPGLKEFLEECNELFEVVFWTAGVASYGYEAPRAHRLARARSAQAPGRAAGSSVYRKDVQHLLH